MLKVKVSSVDPYFQVLALQSPSSESIWDNCEFFMDKKTSNCDYWVIFNALSEKECGFCPKEHTILITTEPYNVHRYSEKFLRQFWMVITAQEELRHPHVIKTHQLLSWWINKSYDDLINMDQVNKTSLISLVVSNKRITREHELRYQFALGLKDYFGDRLDLYGRGINNFDNKWDVLAPYKYTIAIENSSSKNYVTEKFSDALLSYTFPFYYGCTNLSDYYPRDSFEYIDISDIDGSISIIEKILQNPDHYSTHLKSLCDARKKYLNEYQILPLLTTIINALEQEKEKKSVPDQILLQPEKLSLSDLIFKAKSLMSCNMGIR